MKTLLIGHSAWKDCDDRTSVFYYLDTATDLITASDNNYSIIYKAVTIGEFIIACEKAKKEPK